MAEKIGTPIEEPVDIVDDPDHAAELANIGRGVIAAISEQGYSTALLQRLNRIMDDHAEAVAEETPAEEMAEAFTAGPLTIREGGGRFTVLDGRGATVGEFGLVADARLFSAALGLLTALESMIGLVSSGPFDDQSKRAILGQITASRNTAYGI